MDTASFVLAFLLLIICQEVFYFSFLSQSAAELQDNWTEIGKVARLRTLDLTSSCK